MKKSIKIYLISFTIVLSLISAFISFGNSLQGSNFTTFLGVFLGSIAIPFLFGLLGLLIGYIWGKIKNEKINDWKWYLYSALLLAFIILSQGIYDVTSSREAYFIVLIVGIFSIYFTENLNKKITKNAK